MAIDPGYRDKGPFPFSGGIEEVTFSLTDAQP
jgi:hypothetical protein